MDRDEAPPAMFEEGSQSVRNIRSGDNRGSGACIGGQCRSVDDGGTVIIEIID